MSEKVDAFEKAVTVQFKDHVIRIKSRNHSILKLLMYLTILAVLSIFISIQGLNVGLLFLLAVFGTVAYLGYQEIRISLYPLTILDLKKRSILRKSQYIFIKPKTYNFRSLKGISMNVQAVGGYTSAYEDETTDYEKTIILETESGEVPLLNFVSRVEDAEESLSSFLTTIQERLNKSSVS